MKTCKKIQVINLKRTKYGDRTSPCDIIIEEYMSYTPIKDTLSKELDIIKSKKYNPYDGDVLYFHPKCIVPRYKLKEILSPFGVKTTIKEEKSNVKIINKKSINSFFTYEYLYTVRLSDFLLFTDYSSNVSNDIIESIKEHSHFCDKTNEKIIYGKYTTVNVIDNHLSLTNNSRLRCNGIYLNNLIQLKEGLDVNKDYEKFDKLVIDILSNSRDYYMDKSISELLQNESIQIDEEMYTQLCNMLESRDQSNVTMAVEVIANCNINESAEYIYKLMKAYLHNRIIDSKSWNSVNMKSFRETTGFDRNTYFSEDHYISFINKYNSLGKEHIDYIKEKALSTAKTYIKHLFISNIDQKIVNISNINFDVEIKNVIDRDIVLIDDVKVMSDNLV